jgi:hypothetical protein
MNMKQIAGVTAILLTAITASSSVCARDTIVNVPLADVLAMPEAAGKLDGSVKFFLAGQKTPKVISKMGEDSSSKKTNAANKSDIDACKWAALSALITFQGSAQKNNANAVIDIVSNYKNKPSSNPVTLECHAGGIMAGVAIKGTYAKIAK